MLSGIEELEIGENSHHGSTRAWQACKDSGKGRPVWDWLLLVLVSSTAPSCSWAVISLSCEKLTEPNCILMHWFRFWAAVDGSLVVSRTWKPKALEFLVRSRFLSPGLRRECPVQCSRLSTTGVPVLSSSWRSRRVLWQWQLSLWWVDIVGCLLARWDLLGVCNLPKQGDADVPAAARACSVCRGFAEQWILTAFAPLLPKERARAVLFVTAVELLLAVSDCSHMNHSVTVLILLDAGAGKAPYLHSQPVSLGITWGWWLPPVGVWDGGENPLVLHFIPTL